MVPNVLALQVRADENKGPDCPETEAVLTELPWIELDLPTPPSVNTFMGKLGNRSPSVAKWITVADQHYLTQKRRLTNICCPFEAEITFKRDRSDFHNRLKPLFDWMQRVSLIRNDRECERLVAGWGDAEMGCRVRLRPWVTP